MAGGGGGGLQQQGMFGGADPNALGLLFGGGWGGLGGAPQGPMGVPQMSNQMAPAIPPALNRQGYNQFFAANPGLEQPGFQQWMNQENHPGFDAWSKSQWGVSPEQWGSSPKEWQQPLKKLIETQSPITKPKTFGGWG